MIRGRAAGNERHPHLEPVPRDPGAARRHRPRDRELAAAAPRRGLGISRLPGRGRRGLHAVGAAHRPASPGEPDRMVDDRRGPALRPPVRRALLRCLWIARGTGRRARGMGGRVARVVDLGSDHGRGGSVPASRLPDRPAPVTALAAMGHDRRRGSPEWNRGARAGLLASGNAPSTRRTGPARYPGDRGSDGGGRRHAAGCRPGPRQRRGDRPLPPRTRPRASAAQVARPGGERRGRHLRPLPAPRERGPRPDRGGHAPRGRAAGHSGGDRHRDRAPSALRHRPPHQPGAGLRGADDRACGGLRRFGPRPAGPPREHRPDDRARRRWLHPAGGGPLRADPAAAPGRGRPALLPEPIRRAADRRCVLHAAARRGGARRRRGRPARIGGPRHASGVHRRLDPRHHEPGAAGSSSLDAARGRRRAGRRRPMAGGRRSPSGKPERPDHGPAAPVLRDRRRPHRRPRARQ